MTVIGFILLLQFSCTEEKFLTFVNDMTISVNNEYGSGKAWVTYSNNDNTKYNTNFEIDIVKGGINYISFNIKVSSAELTKSKKPKIYKKICDVNIDFCKFLKKQSQGDMYVGYFLELTKRHGRAFTCPLEVGKYYGYNISMDTVNIPGFTKYFLGQAETIVKLQFYGKVNKKLVSFFNYTIVGGYKNI